MEPTLIFYHKILCIFKTWVSMETMKKFYLAILAAFLGIAFNILPQEAGKIRALVIVGGHDFQTNQFYQIFKDNSDITFEVAEHPNALKFFKPENASRLDVVILYDLWQKITDEDKENFIKYLESGKGLIILHHAIANYQDWPEYEKILGGRYYLQKKVVDGVEKARSIYKHGVKFTVKIADDKHPITQGLQDFTIIDETYNLYDVSPDNHILLTTDEPTSHKYIGWARTYKNARVVYIQLGHDRFAYENKNYRNLLSRSILWVCKKLN